jgi:hypothetical protein
VWYLAEILFAEPRQEGRKGHQCESCNVVIDAPDAVAAYRKAMAWGERYAAEPPASMALLGVSHLTTIGDHLGDGVEICGRFFDADDVWDRVEDHIPPPEELRAVMWERGRDTPLGELLDTEQIKQLKRVL